MADALWEEMDMDASLFPRDARPSEKGGLARK
jgi:hypothetical protein